MHRLATAGDVSGARARLTYEAVRRRQFQLRGEFWVKLPPSAPGCSLGVGACVSGQHIGWRDTHGRGFCSAKREGYHGSVPLTIYGTMYRVLIASVPIARWSRSLRVEARRSVRFSLLPRAHLRPDGRKSYRSDVGKQGFRVREMHEGCRWLHQIAEIFANPARLSKKRGRKHSVLLVAQGGEAQRRSRPGRFLSIGQVLVRTRCFLPRVFGTGAPGTAQGRNEGEENQEGRARTVGGRRQTHQV